MKYPFRLLVHRGSLKIAMHREIEIPVALATEITATYNSMMQAYRARRDFREYIDLEIDIDFPDHKYSVRGVRRQSYELASIQEARRRKGLSEKHKRAIAEGMRR